MSTYNVAIAGAGPRGLAALESLANLLTEQKEFEHFSIRMFDASGYWGSGPNHAPDQMDANRINLSERETIIRERNETSLYPGFPSYHEWAAIDVSDPDVPDTYPSRSKLGRYLLQRFESLAIALENAGILKRSGEKITAIHHTGDGLRLVTENKEVSCHELLLCIGHQPTRPDDELLSWRKNVTPGLILREKPYPLRNYLPEQVSKHDTFAIRGYGLSFLDIATGLAGLTGEFRITDPESLRVSFNPRTNQLPLVVPYSDDGLPPVPKPVSQSEQDKYAPGNLDTFKKALLGEMDSPRTYMEFFIRKMAALTMQVYRRIHGRASETIENLLADYMQKETYTHPAFTDYSQSPAEVLDELCKISCGVLLPTLDYCLGQVWRHCRPVFYEVFRHPDLPDEVMYKLIQLDERMKRYTYGPPLISIRELLAMYEAGMADLSVVKDPQVVLTPEGWRLMTPDGERTATCMINGVLDPPNIALTKTGFLQQMLDHGEIDQFYDLGARTNPDATLIGHPGNASLTGRLAKGRILGSDSILECFNEEPDLWAAGVFSRWKKG